MLFDDEKSTFFFWWLASTEAFRIIKITRVQWQRNKTNLLYTRCFE